MTTYDHTLLLKERSDEKKQQQEQEKVRKSSMAALQAAKNEKLMERMGEENPHHGNYYKRHLSHENNNSSPQAQVSIINSEQHASLPPLVSYTNSEVSRDRANRHSDHSSPKPAYNYLTNKNPSDDMDPPYLARNKAHLNQTFTNDYDYSVNRSPASNKPTLHTNVYQADGYQPDGLNESSNYNRFDYYNNGSNSKGDDESRRKQRAVAALNPSSLAGLRSSNSNVNNKTSGIPCINDHNSSYPNTNSHNNNSNYLFVDGDKGGNESYDEQSPRVVYNNRLPPINATNSRKEPSRSVKTQHKSRIVSTNQALSDANEMNESKLYRKSSLSNSRSRTLATDESHESAAEYDELVTALKTSRALRRSSVDSRKVKF